MRFLESPEFAKQNAGDARGADAGVRKFVSGSAEMSPAAGNRQVRFVISTGDVDRDNDTIDPNGWDLNAYKQNPVVLFGHNSRDLPVGKAISVGVEQGQLVAVCEFATHEFAETVFQLYRGGFMRATSVGFRPTSYVINEERRGIDFKQQELLEFSCVPVPANPMALVAAAAALDLEPLRKWIGETIAAWPEEIKLPGKVWAKLGAAAETPAAVAPAPVTITINTFDPAAFAKAIEADPKLGALVTAALARKADEPAPVEPVVEPPAPADPPVEPVVPADPPAEALPPAEASCTICGTTHAIGTCAPDAIIFELDDEADEITAEDIQAALRATLPGIIRDVTREMTERALNQARGRLD
jgi:HK97 family phage prohead protease